MPLPAIPIISGIVGLGKTVGKIFQTWQERKVVKAKGKVRIEEAKVEGKIKRELSIIKGDTAYNVSAVRGMAASFKDELFVIVWLGILVALFVPYTQPYIKDGFVFLQANTPWWYEYSLLGMVCASFGLKGWNMWKRGTK